MANDDRVITYRQHTPGDMGWIVERHALLYGETHGWDDTFEGMVARICADFLEGFDPERERSWIAEVDGRRAGAIALVKGSETRAVLRLLFVEPWARGLGIGATLVRSCVEHARRVGYETMTLSTVRGLDAARRLYEHEGFRLTDETERTLWGKTEWEQKWAVDL